MRTGSTCATLRPVPAASSVVGDGVGGERMKRIGVLGGIGPQATIDFEARVHVACQQLIPQHWNLGYPPMAVWYHRGYPVLMAGEGQPVKPRQVDPGLVEGAA